MSLTDDDVRRLRLMVREELALDASRRKGQRPPGERRLRSAALLATIAPRPAEPLDEVTAAKVRRAVERRAARAEDAHDVVGDIPIEIVEAHVFDESVRLHEGPCCYLLTRDGAVVYVGKSVRGFSFRYADHLTSKGGRFDRVVVVSIVPPPWLDVPAYVAGLEGALFDRYAPPLNRWSIPCLASIRSAWSKLVDLFAAIDEARA